MFQAKSFTPASFSIQSFKMAEQAQARSGYWRLFYYKMQEESLKKNEQEQREKEEKRTGESEKAITPAIPAKKRARRKPVELEEEVWEPPELPKLIYQRVAPPVFNPVTQFLSIITTEFRQLHYSIYPLEVKLAEKEIELDEEDIEMLLLAA